MREKISYKSVFIFLILIISHNRAAAQIAPEYYYSKWRSPPYRTAVVNKGNSTKELFGVSSARRQTSVSIIESAGEIIKKNHVFSLLLIDENNEIIFESYSKGARKDSILLGHSMTKSISPIIVGQYVCDGLIESLNDRADKYSKSLKGTAYGDATIKELLMMASTGSIAAVQGQPVEGFNRDLMLTQKRSLKDSFVEFGRDQKNPSKIGVFSYKALDTIALSFVVSEIKNTKYQNVISQYVWSKIGAEKNAEIVIDRNNDALAASHFGATPRDWARLAIFVRDNAKANTCFGKFLKEATSGQIKNNSNIAPGLTKYGYQIWTDNKFVESKAAWFSGYGGQLVGIDLERGKILVMLSYDRGGIREAYKLFNKWIKS